MGTVTKQQNKIPELRFPGFKDDWQQKPLSIVAKIQRGRFSPRPRNDPRFYGGKTPFVQTGDVVNSGGYIEHYTQTLNDEGVKVSKIFPKGSILMTIAANIGYTGILSKDMACPDSLIGIIPNADTNNEFLNHFLTTQREYMDRVASVGAQKNINIDFLTPFPVNWTVLPEQQEIADFLGSVDAWLDNLRQQKTAIEAYKRGMMQKLFTQQVRFKDDGEKGFPKWQEKKLGQIEDSGDLKLGRGNVISKRDMVSNPGEYPIYSSSVKDNGLFGKYGSYMFDEELITWSVDGGGHFFYRPEHKFSITNVSGWMRVLNYSMVTKFLAYQLQYHHTKLVFDYSSKAHPSVIRGMYTISLPSKKEQQKIADFLTALDETITAKAEEITKVEQWKKGLMQKMFV